MSLKLGAAILLAAMVGIGCGEVVCHSLPCRDAIGRICGRGHLLTLVGSQGIYQADVEGATTELRNRGEQNELDATGLAFSRRSILSRLIGVAVAQFIAAQEKVGTSEVERELHLLQSQFRDRKTWTTALRTNGLSERSLRKLLKDNLRVRKWIDRQIVTQLEVTNEERRKSYGQHMDKFLLPARIKASHLFLAAPPESTPEIVDLKKEKIALLAKRIKDGENFAELVAVESEDEMSKTHGGDLGYFSVYRTPPDFYAAVAKLRPGEISAPVRTALGFHIIQVVEIHPAGQMTFEEAKPEIGRALEQEKRQAALGRVNVDLGTRGSVISRVFEEKL